MLIILVLLFLCGCSTVRIYKGENSGYDDRNKNTEGAGIVVGI